MRAPTVEVSTACPRLWVPPTGQPLQCRQRHCQLSGTFLKAAPYALWLLFLLHPVAWSLAGP